MIGRLLQKLVDEVPEELSICEFDCPVTKCTARDWSECELRHQAALYGCGVSRDNSSLVQTKASAIATNTTETTAI